MTLVKVPHRSFEQSFNNILDDFFTTTPSLLRNGVNGSAGTLNIPVNIRQHESGYELQVVAPGFEKESFKIDLEKGLLTVSAEQKAEAENKEDKFIRKEYSQRSFKRSFNLDDQIDTEKIAAKYQNGILVLNLPKKVEVKEPVKQISIQ